MNEKWVELKKKKEIKYRLKENVQVDNIGSNGTVFNCQKGNSKKLDPFLKIICFETYSSKKRKSFHLIKE